MALIPGYTVNVFQPTSFGNYNCLNFKVCRTWKRLFNFIQESRRGVNVRKPPWSVANEVTVDTIKCELIYFSLLTPYSVKTVLDHFLIKSLCSIIAQNLECFPSPVSLLFHLRLESAAVKVSPNFAVRADLKLPDAIPVVVKKTKKQRSS